MAKFTVCNDSEVFARMLAGPLIEAGHEVQIEVVPIDFERIVRFRPEALIFGISRRPEALDRPIRDPERDILGYHALVDLLRYPAINVLPIVIVATGIPEDALPDQLLYDAFLGIPGHLGDYVSQLEAIAAQPPQRRSLSDYGCPQCRSRLIYHRRPDDLFCPRCNTAVAVVQGEGALVLDQDFSRTRVEMEALEPPQPFKPEGGRE